MKKIEICAVIPARSGSKQIKDKNILKFSGKPSMYYSIKAAQNCKKISKVLFTSDSKQYINIAKKYNPDFLHLRSKKNSSPKSTDYDFLKEVYFFLIDKYNYKPDVFALLRANNPTKSMEDINGAVDFFLKNYKSYSALRSVNLMSETSYKTFYIKKNILHGVMTNNSKIDKLNLPKEKFINTYTGNGSIDLIKVKNIDKKFLHGNKCYGYVTKHICVDIDYKNDIDYANFILKKKDYIK